MGKHHQSSEPARPCRCEPWPGVVARTLAGGLQIWRVEGRLTALMTSYAVKDVHELAFTVSSGQRIDEGVVFTQADAANFLKTTSVKVNGLVRLDCGSRLSFPTQAFVLSLAILPWRRPIACIGWRNTSRPQCRAFTLPETTSLQSSIRKDQRTVTPRPCKSPMCIPWRTNLS